MANSAQAKKRARQNDKRRLHCASQRSMLRTHIKNVLKAIASGNTEAANEAYKKAVPVIDSMTGKGLMHKNKAARHKSRLNMHVKAMQA
ncbi:MAG: 30S ribosomal protein S20 [Gammaproteobacteria bacterium]